MINLPLKCKYCPPKAKFPGMRFRNSTFVSIYYAIPTGYTILSLSNCESVPFDDKYPLE